MSRENTKKLIYLQRFGLLILGSILSMTVFFVVQNTVRAQNDLIVFSTPIIQEEEKTITYDINSDTSLQKYLSANTPFVDTNYIPADLLPINSNFTANTSKAFKLREEAGIQFADMVWHFWNEFHGDKIRIASAYRSMSTQDYMLKKGCSRARCALAGTSEHQAGLAVDIKIISKNGKGYTLYSGSAYYKWFAENAHLRGFHNTYQKGIDIDGQMTEGRHRRYVGSGLATQLYTSGLTFAEYFSGLQINTDDTSTGPR